MMPIKEHENGGNKIILTLVAKSTTGTPTHQEAIAPSVNIHQMRVNSTARKDPLHNRKIIES